VFEGEEESLNSITHSLLVTIGDFMNYLKAAMEMLMPRATAHDKIIKLYKNQEWEEFLKACNAYNAVYE
jgi:hypothetical protein